MQGMKRKRQLFVYGKHSINVYLSLLEFLSDVPICRTICLLIHWRLLLWACLNTQQNKKIYKHKNAAAFPTLAIWNYKVGNSSRRVTRVCSTVTMAEQGAHRILLLLWGEINNTITHVFLAGPDHLETSLPHTTTFPFHSCCCLMR